MLNMNNLEDKEKMMNYHRTRDMLNLLTYFPDLSPIKNITIVESVNDYLENYEFCKNFVGERNDTLITKPSMPSVEGTGINPNIIDILKKVKEIDSDGVMVLFDLTHKSSERYERYAGISVRIDLGECVIIEAVSKGFDGREVSKSICTHERYYIPWYDLRKISINNFKNYQTYQIDNKKYQETRKERIKFLTSIGLESKIVSKNIPENYQAIPDFIWLSVIKNLLKQLEKNEDFLTLSGFTNFAISGHTEGNEFKPWQMFDKKRYITQEKI